MLTIPRSNAIITFPAGEDLTDKEGCLCTLDHEGVHLHLSDDKTLDGVILQGAAEGEPCVVALAGSSNFSGTVMIRLRFDCLLAGSVLITSDSGEAIPDLEEYVSPGETIFGRALETGKAGEMVEAFFLLEPRTVE